MHPKLTAVFQRDDDSWVAWLEEIPGANTQGETLDEARENLRDAVRELFAARVDAKIPNPSVPPRELRL